MKKHPTVVSDHKGPVELTFSARSSARRRIQVICIRIRILNSSTGNLSKRSTTFTERNNQCCGAGAATFRAAPKPEPSKKVAAPQHWKKPFDINFYIQNIVKFQNYVPNPSNFIDSKSLVLSGFDSLTPEYHRINCLSDEYQPEGHDDADTTPPGT